MHLDFKPMEFSDVLSYIQSGKADFGCGSILITKERAEAMDFATRTRTTSFWWCAPRMAGAVRKGAL